LLVIVAQKSLYVNTKNNLLTLLTNQMYYIKKAIQHFYIKSMKLACVSRNSFYKYKAEINVETYAKLYEERSLQNADSFWCIGAILTKMQLLIVMLLDCDIANLMTPRC